MKKIKKKYEFQYILGIFQLIMFNTRVIILVAFEEYILLYNHLFNASYRNIIDVFLVFRCKLAK